MDIPIFNAVHTFYFQQYTLVLFCQTGWYIIFTQHGCISLTIVTYICVNCTSQTAIHMGLWLLNHAQTDRITLLIRAVR